MNIALGFQKPRYGCALAALAVLLLLAGAFVLMRKSLLEREITAFLELRGITNIQMTLAEADPSRVWVNDISFKAKDSTVAAGRVAVDGLFSAKNREWAGQWEVKNLRVINPVAQMPSFNGAGDLFLRLDGAVLQGKFIAANNSGDITVAAKFDFAASEKSILTVSEAAMPWSGGKLSAQNVQIPITNNASFDVSLKVAHVSANALLQQFTGNRASATGTISGTLPMTIKTDGVFVVRGGRLQADTYGIIALSPDVIPGDHPQVALVRDVLRDFHYTSLILNLSGGEGRLDVRMALEGSNPEVQGGRPVKINMNLGGDMLNLVKENLLWLTDPRKIIERGQNAKP